MLEFENKVVLITGGSSGLGRAMAMAFAQRGACVAIAARREERGRTVVREIEGRGGKAMFVPCDVAIGEEVERLVAETVMRFGRLDVAINNAAETNQTLRLTAEYTEVEFDRAVAVNLKGVWLCMKAEIIQMLRQNPQGGVILNTSSVNGLGGIPRAALYAATKAGVLGLTKSAALEYAANGIRVNALVLGAFDTEMRQQILERIAGGDARKREQLRAGEQGRIPLGRMGMPEEAAEAATWLCSNAASYITGVSFIVDGGLTAFAR
ncbi:glucose 1-dehydrogenase [Rhodocaloribacter litoris]|uniref:SDR family NAD(P)-dependent oxidoreductase n=1 Tax=Rhodocaloribacter litoris TaxID=2558931 RepID=UPI0014206307|nr:glucose 1-dehydrogenase [Rhodocaloribacter litoris]QXD13689.1 glucose 1-dehydrogenase [Rhodocaloribacter litoris]